MVQTEHIAIPTTSLPIPPDLLAVWGAGHSGVRTDPGGAADGVEAAPLLPARGEGVRSPPVASRRVHLLELLARKLEWLDGTVCILLVCVLYRSIENGPNPTN